MYEIYTQLLLAAVLFWNFARVITYLPTIRKLQQPTATALEYSVLTWLSWIFANGTMALWLADKAGYQWNETMLTALTSVANTAMCSWTTVLIVLRQRQARQLGQGTLNAMTVMERG